MTRIEIIDKYENAAQISDDSLESALADAYDLPLGYWDTAEVRGERRYGWTICEVVFFKQP